MPKQQQLPGVGPKQIEEIEDKAEEVRTLCASRKDLAQKEETARKELKDLFKKHGIRKCYQYVIDDGEGGEIKIDALLERPEERAYVRKHKDPKAKDDSEGSEEPDEKD